jgi:hypothetical protein
MSENTKDLEVVMTEALRAGIEFNLFLPHTFELSRVIRGTVGADRVIYGIHKEHFLGGHLDSVHVLLHDQAITESLTSLPTDRFYALQIPDCRNSPRGAEDAGKLSSNVLSYIDSL